MCFVRPGISVYISKLLLFLIETFVIARDNRKSMKGMPVWLRLLITSIVCIKKSTFHPGDFLNGQQSTRVTFMPEGIGKINFLGFKKDSWENVLKKHYYLKLFCARKIVTGVIRELLLGSIVSITNHENGTAIGILRTDYANFWRKKNHSLWLQSTSGRWASMGAG